jgi:predicted acylesterase/phospholipase RssA
MIITNQQAKLQRSQEQYHSNNNNSLQISNENNSYVKSVDLQKKYVSFKPDNAVDIENKKTRPHRALVLQGGGALGAYEAGVFKALFERITKDDELTGQKNRPLFDIVAGTSIGAVNAAILVGYVKQNRTWEGSDKALYQFWDDLCNPTWWAPKELFDNPLFTSAREFWINNVLDNQSMWISWDYWKNLRDTWNGLYQVNENLLLSYSQFPPVLCWKEDWPYFDLVGIYKNKSGNYDIKTEDWREERPWISFFFWRPDNLGPISSGETARRYFSYLSSVLAGVPHVLAPGIMQPDWKFFNFLQPFTRFDNKPLERTIKKYWDYDNLPLQTAFEKNEPRLLLVSVDVQDCTSAVTFDSYPKSSDGKRCRTEYGEDQVKKYVMEYDGITIEHVNASMSTHLRYKYPHFPAQEIITTQIDGQKDKKQTIKQQNERYYWDGAYLSNTPLRELLQAHRDYWHKVRKTEVPDLEVYIVNLYPSTENSLQDVIADADVIQDREIDIKFHDRTKYDIQVSNTITDYVDLNNAIIDLAMKHAKDKNALQTDLAKIMDSNAKSKGRDGIRRKYRELLDGRFNVIRVGYIERQDDDNTIFGKAFEFSYYTINSLRDKGYQEAQKNIRYE